MSETPAERPNGKAGKSSKNHEDATAMAPVTAEPQRKAFEIAPDKTSLAEQVYNRFWVAVPAGTQAEDLDLKERPFALIAGLLHECDDIRAVTADKRTIFDLVVVHRSGNQARCRVTQVIRIPEIKEEDVELIPAGYEVVRAGPADPQPGWLVRRKNDPSVILNYGQECYDKARAIAFLLNHPAVRGDVPQGMFRPTMG